MTSSQNDQYCDPNPPPPHPQKMNNRSFVFEKNNLQTRDKY